MKKYSELDKNKYMTNCTKNGLIYSAIVCGAYVYHGFYSEMPVDRNLIVVHRELQGDATFPICDAIVDMAIRTQTDIFVVEVA